MEDIGDMVFIDWETTGLIKPEANDIAVQPYATEFYGIRITQSWEFISEFESLVKPPIPIPKDIEEMIGITNDMVKDSPSFVEIYKDLVHLFMGTEFLVAHNCAFDRDILKYELTRSDLQFKFPWPINHICTVEKSFSINNKRLTLSKLHELATGEPHEEGAHRSKTDVMALVRSFQWLQENGFV